MMQLDKLAIATGNHGKFREFQVLASEIAHDVIFAPEIADLVVNETGRTYGENAFLKARAWSVKSGLPCLADDSGLEVNALGGGPGLYSARIAPGDDCDKVSWLLSRLEHANTHDRAARFAASLALCVPDEFMLVCDGSCYGRIADTPAGTNGFGYDPVFIPDGYDRTFAELAPETKNLISHRTNAFRKITRILNAS